MDYSDHESVYKNSFDSQDDQSFDLKMSKTIDQIDSSRLEIIMNQSLELR